MPLAAGARAGRAVTLAVRAEDVLVARRAPGPLGAQRLEARIAALARTGADVILRCAPVERAGAPQWLVRLTPAAVDALGLAAGLRSGSR